MRAFDSVTTHPTLGPIFRPAPMHLESRTWSSPIVAWALCFYRGNLDCVDKDLNSSSTGPVRCNTIYDTVICSGSLLCISLG